MASDAAYQRLGMRIFADFSGTIAVPAVLAALLGKRLDDHFDTEPKLIILCLALAMVMTGALIIRKARRYSAEYAKLNEPK